jgi:GNAT superfamily N-acetyltransferase
VAAPDLSVELADPDWAAEHSGDCAALHAEVYAAPPYDEDAAGGARFDRLLAVQRRQPGFGVAVARSGGYLIGLAFGAPLRPSTSWWRGLTTALPADVTTEHPGRTFAVADLLVRAAWRRQGIGAELHDLLLGERSEERATRVLWPGAAAAQAAARSWGWTRLARRQDSDPGAPVLDVLVLDLPIRHRPPPDYYW